MISLNNVSESAISLERSHTTCSVLTASFTETGCRVGELRALDLGDLGLEGERPRADWPAIHFIYRPETDTPLKNKEKGEPWNVISPHVAQTGQDYLDGPRDDVVDEHGRSPLVTTRYGRVSCPPVEIRCTE